MTDQSDATRIVRDTAASSRLLVRGLTWTVAYQIFEVMVGFVSMLVLIRILHPVDYGRAAAVTGVLALINTFNAHLFVEHALQLPHDQEPDWQLHWTAACSIQLALSAAGHAAAGLCWLSPKLRPMAGLLHLASFGLLAEAPSLVGNAMLRRELDIRRMRILGGIVMCVRLAMTIAMALAGAGAYALVLGNNVVPAVVFSVDLLMVRRWRPDAGWFRRAWWREYAGPGRFGLQRAGAQLIVTLRGAMESALVPIPLGFAALGLIGRAQVLYSNTFGRVGNVIADVVYPFLPRSSHDRARYASRATMYLRVMLIVSVPSALFVAQYGPLLSRVLYGGRWRIMDPLIQPGSVVGLAVSILSVAAAILLAAGQVRDCLVFEAMAGIGSIPALAVAWVSRDAFAYSWACAGVETLVAIAALWRARRLLTSDWFGHGVLPPVVSAVGGLVLCRTCQVLVDDSHPLWTLVVTASIYAFANLMILRTAFASSLDQLLAYAPAGHRLRRMVRLRAGSPALGERMIPEL